MIWGHEHIKRIILDLSLKVTGRPFTGDGAFYQTAGADWKDDLGLDSIEFMALAAAANSFFNLFEISKAPYLLSFSKVDDWVALILDARQRNDGSLAFNTSGTSGQTKTIRHKVAFLEREIDFLAAVFHEANCIVPYVPSYTIYGFLLTVGLPNRLQVPLLYPSGINWQQLPQNAFIVATPFHWNLLAGCLPPIALNCLGVSSGAPLYNALYQDITSKGIRLTELYGSTETSGIAYRQHGQQPFQLFPFWEFTGDDKVMDSEDNRIFALMDDIERVGDNSFSITGRKDKQIKVAGKLTDLDSVAHRIKELANVKQCNISAKTINNELFIQAALVLFNDGEQQRADIKTEIRKVLLPHERPRDIYFGG
jgi:4-coumarate--CoA ligase (photoactive yellow protein activation family)